MSCLNERELNLTGIVRYLKKMGYINEFRAPYIGVNKNWWYDGKDLGIRASGDPGQNGHDGVDGLDGLDGQDGISPHIDQTTGNWFVGATDTGVKAQGPQGPPGPAGRGGGTGSGQIMVSVNVGNFMSQMTAFKDFHYVRVDLDADKPPMDVIEGFYYIQPVITSKEVQEDFKALDLFITARYPDHISVGTYADITTINHAQAFVLHYISSK